MKLHWSDNNNARFSVGYGYTPDSLYKHIGSSGLPIYRTRAGSYTTDQSFGPGLNIGYSIREKIENEIIINHSVAPDFLKSDLYSVGFTFWETTRLPKEWVDSCNQMDEVWTCSKVMEQVFIESGVNKPVYEFKLGVDPDLYFPKKRTPHDVFTFLSIGSPSTRKNSQMSVDAFLKVFGDNENFRLIYKSNGEPDARMIVGGYKGPIQHPRITIIDDEVSHERLSEIYDMADCLLYPTRGEGWGNIPFQGIGKGIPTICTNALACTEFADMSVPLDFKWSSDNLFGSYIGCGEWADPDFDDLCDKMRYVVENYETVSQKTYENAVWINENMTWQKVSEKYIKRMQTILESEIKC